MATEHLPHPGCPSISRSDKNIQKVQEAVLADRQPNTDELAEVPGLNRSSVERILTQDTSMRHVSAKSVL